MTLGGAAVGGVHLQNLRSTLSPASANKRSGQIGRRQTLTTGNQSYFGIIKTKLAVA